MESVICLSPSCRMWNGTAYYDLSINMEGIDAIHHLLARMEEMQREIHSLRGRLRLHGEY